MHTGMRRTPYAIAAEIDRCLSLSLSNGEFEIVAQYIEQSEDPEETGKNLINTGSKSVWLLIETSRK